VLILIVLGLAAAVAALAFALLHDNGSKRSPSTGRTGGAPIGLTGVGSYDPPPGNGQEHNDDVAKATDSSPSTYWETEHYRSSLASLGKRGVGLVLDARTPVTVHQITVTTDTPGFTAQIQVGDSAGGPFRTVSASKRVLGQTTFDLQDAHGRYYVVWITNLGSLSSAHVNSVRAS
jgi:hypothetical protein